MEEISEELSKLLAFMPIGEMRDWARACRGVVGADTALPPKAERVVVFCGVLMRYEGGMSNGDAAALRCPEGVVRDRGLGEVSAGEGELVVERRLLTQYVVTTSADVDRLW